MLTRMHASVEKVIARSFPAVPGAVPAVGKAGEPVAHPISTEEARP
jgi:hypothetical protein